MNLQLFRPLVHVVDRERLRIEVIAYPLSIEEFFVPFMLGIADRFQQKVETV